MTGRFLTVVATLTNWGQIKPGGFQSTSQHVDCDVPDRSPEQGRDQGVQPVFAEDGSANGGEQLGNGCAGL